MLNSFMLISILPNITKSIRRLPVPLHKNIRSYSTNRMSVDQSESQENLKERTIATYGGWKSPVMSSMGSCSLGRINLQIDSHPDKQDTVYWLEHRASEGGRSVVCSSTMGQDGVTVWTQENFNVRTTVHEYGGGAFFVHDGCLYFSNNSDQRMYIQRGHDVKSLPLTPARKWRFADGHFSQKTQHIYCVREDHEVDNLQNAVNTIVTIEPRSRKQMILVKGADFYSHPRVSPDGSKICWIQWDHPNMPWDLTELWVAELSPTGDKLVKDSSVKIACDASLMMPSFDSNNELLYVSDKSDWWNLYRMTAGGEHVNLLPVSEEIGHPHWQFGNEEYAVDPGEGDNIVVLVAGKFGVLNRKSGEYRLIDTGYVSHSNVCYSCLGHAYCDAGGPTQLSAIIRVHIETGKVDVIRESHTPLVDPGYLSVPHKISLKGADGAKGFFYPPCNKDFTAPEGTLPPLLVKAHGGPTACADVRLNYKYQYFTSRGFAVFDIDYRGSTGYGRAFRNSLANNWGVYDIEDCCEGAKHLAEMGLVDGNKLCISGSSAGGYVTLACLTMHDTFKAGVSSYGIADLKILTEESHKFEARYTDGLIAPVTEEGLEIYKERSPITHIDNIRCPIAFFHGSEDKVVPPNQSEMMYSVVKEKKIPTAMCIFEGEQHGFRKSENIEKALDGEFYFFSRVLGFEPADKNFVFHIDNLD